jgi:ABC-type glutathione transport system ATPase component
VVLDGVDLDVREGEVVALVGPTGSGKSTLARILLRLDEADQGAVEIEGRDLLALDGAELRAARQRIQLLFQDPFEAFSPRMTVGEAIREPLDVQRVGTPREREEAVDRALAAVGLAAGLAGRRTHELSGGQLQRVALARALALRPKLLVADEPVAHLDPSEQAKVLQMLKSLQVESGMAMLLISHDLAVVLRVADRILVLDGGHVVERGTGTSLFLAPQHPTTRALLGAAGRDAFLRRLDRAGTALAAPDPPPARQQVLVGAALTNTDHMEGSE